MHNKNRLNKEIAALIKREAAVIAELEKLFPENHKVLCWIMSGQVNPSIGEVVGVEGGRYAEVIVRLQSRKGEVRRVPADKILDCWQPRAGDISPRISPLK